MGAIGARVEALIEGLRDTPWPDPDRVIAWANGVADDPRAAFGAAARADDALVIAAAFETSPKSALAFVAAELRAVAGRIGLREPRLARMAFAAEQGGARPAARAKVLDDAKSLLVDAHKAAAAVARQTTAPRMLSQRAAMELGRASAFLGLAVVSAEASGIALANVAHAIRQVAVASASHRLAAGEAARFADATTLEALSKAVDAAIEAATDEEMASLGPKIRAAIEPDFARVTGPA